MLFGRFVIPSKYRSWESAGCSLVNAVGRLLTYFYFFHFQATPWILLSSPMWPTRSWNPFRFSIGCWTFWANWSSIPFTSKWLSGGRLRVWGRGFPACQTHTTSTTWTGQSWPWIRVMWSPMAHGRNIRQVVESMSSPIQCRMQIVYPQSRFFYFHPLF